MSSLSNGMAASWFGEQAWQFPDSRAPAAAVFLLSSWPQLSPFRLTFKDHFFCPTMLFSRYCRSGRARERLGAESADNDRGLPMSKEEDGRSNIKCRRCNYDFPPEQLQKNCVCPVCDAPRPMRSLQVSSVCVGAIQGKARVA
jgi:hypothetical protein